jgi:hypothetical protein
MRVIDTTGISSWSPPSRASLRPTESGFYGSRCVSAGGNEVNCKIESRFLALQKRARGANESIDLTQVFAWSRTTLAK